MFPIALDVSRIKIVLIGTGDFLKKRVQQLDEAGAKHVQVFEYVEGMVIKEDDLRSSHIVLVTGIKDEVSFDIARIARKLGILVNVEDRKEYCDFYYSSIMRRGDLLISINTSGKAPALSVRIRKKLEKMFPPIWAQHLSTLSELRENWLKEGCDSAEIIKRSNDFLDKSTDLDGTTTINN